MDDFETSELREFSEKRKFFVDSEDLNKKRRKESISAIESLKCAYEEEVTRAEFAEKAYQELYQKFLQSRYCKEFEEGPLLGFGSYGRVFRSTHRLDQCDYAIKRVRFVGSSEILLPEVHALSKLKHEGVIRYYNSWIEVDLITPDMDVEIISYDGNCKIDEDKDGNGDGDESESESESAESKSAESKSESEDEDEDENKIRYFQIGEIQDPELVYFSLFIQMELCKESLSDALQSETIIDYNEGLEYFRQIVEAVSYMHEQGVVHKDLGQPISF
ncbi:hypothetical protein MKW92_004628 [Papaver armeniacum]|nr:hypothetical protein MKW92_004628 [Papaver armeniacum]